MELNSLDASNMNIDKIGDALQRVNFSAGKQAEKALKDLLEQALQKGLMPKEALRINDDTMEAIYTQAYNLYNQGKYKEASYIFRMLMILDMTTPKFTLGLAACLHRMKDYVNAANLYLLCASLDPKNPMPHYHAADCYLQMNTIHLAIVSLKMAIDAAGDQPQFSVVKERAALLKSSLEVQAKERAEKLAQEEDKGETAKEKVA
mgnify:CR=1 FL=1